MKEEATEVVAAAITLNVRPRSDDATLLVRAGFPETEDFFNQIRRLAFWAKCHAVPRGESNGTGLFLRRRPDTSSWVRIIPTIAHIISVHQNSHADIDNELGFHYILDEVVQIIRDAPSTVVTQQ